MFNSIPISHKDKNQQNNGEQFLLRLTTQKEQKFQQEKLTEMVCWRQDNLIQTLLD